MTLNQIIGNKERTSRIDTELWKKMNEKYSKINNTTEEKRDKNFMQKIKYDENGKPTIKLTPEEKTLIHIPTQKEYDVLMQIYDAGNWKWGGVYKSITVPNHWTDYNNQTCIDIKDNMCYYCKSNYNRKIISIQEFCTVQKINQDIINQLNQYYDKHYPNRASKG